MVVGSTGPASGSTIDARVLGALIGIKFKVVTGYADARRHPARLRARRDRRLLRAARLRAQDRLLGASTSPAAWRCRCRWGSRSTPSSPTSRTPMSSSKREEDRQLFQLIFGPWSYGRPLFAPPGHRSGDASRRCATALAATLKDPAYLAETKKLNMEIQPIAAGDHRQAGGPDPAERRRRWSSARGRCSASRTGSDARSPGVAIARNPRMRRGYVHGRRPGFR